MTNGDSGVTPVVFAPHTKCKDSPAYSRVLTSELEIVRDRVHMAITPEVRYTGDMEGMAKEAADITSQSLYLILGWVQQYVEDKE